MLLEESQISTWLCFVLFSIYPTRFLFWVVVVVVVVVCVSCT